MWGESGLRGGLVRVTRPIAGTPSPIYPTRKRGETDTNGKAVVWLGIRARIPHPTNTAKIGKRSGGKSPLVLTFFLSVIQSLLHTRAVVPRNTYLRSIRSFTKCKSEAIGSPPQ